MILVDEKLGLYLDFKTYTNNERSIYDFSSKEIHEINTLIENATFISRYAIQYTKAYGRRTTLQSKNKK